MLRFLAIAASSYLLSFSVHFLLFTGAALLWDLLARQRATNGEGLRAIAIVSLIMAVFDAPLAMYFAYAIGLFGR